MERATLCINVEIWIPVKVVLRRNLLPIKLTILNKGYKNLYYFILMTFIMFFIP